MENPDYLDEEQQATTILVPVSVPLTIIVMILVYAFYVTYSINQNRVNDEFKENLVDCEGNYYL